MSTRSSDLRSRAARRFAFGRVAQRHACGLGLPFLLAILAACVEPKPGSQSAEGPPELQLARLAIDEDESLQLEPGAGVGVAVAYEGSGTWRVSTACDTLASGGGTPCQFDLILRSAGDDDLVLVDDAELEPRDQSYFLDPFALELLLETGDDVDSVTVSASPGAFLRLTAWLYDPIGDTRVDWTRDPRLISWVGHGAVNWGAPTNPVDLDPELP